MTQSLPSTIREKALEKEGFQHAFFTRQGGVSSGLYSSLNGGLGSADHADSVHENRRRMADHMAVMPEHFLSLYQIHSADVVTVSEAWAIGDRPKADAMVTNREGIALAIATADCGPVLFADHHARVIGAAHAGWKGAFSGILEATVSAMEKLGADRRNMIAVLGPTISQAAYEVGSDFKAQFIAADAGYDRFFRAGNREEKSFFNLPAFIEHRLQTANIGSFLSLDLCTYRDQDRFFSFRRTTHRAEQDYGRLISAISLIP